MQNLLSNSLRDCGYGVTDFGSADIVIVIQHLPGNKRVEGKKYILLQTEQIHRFDIVKYSEFKPDKVWGFGIDQPEEYICLGYHPCLEIPYEVSKDINVGFFGCMTDRRRVFLDGIRNKFSITSTWDYSEKIKSIQRSKINLNSHSYSKTTYTEWDRICLPLANKSFILSEKFYCPLPIIQYESISDYDELVDFYLSHEKERQDIADSLYDIYKRDFDMRNILIEKLKGV
jgi:hypothetical protein